VLIMDVVRQVVKAAQDHIDSQRSSSTGKKKSSQCCDTPTYIIGFSVALEQF